MTAPDFSPSRALFRLGAFCFGAVLGSALVAVWASAVDRKTAPPPQVCITTDRQPVFDHRVIYNGTTPSGNKCFVVEVLR